MRIPRLTGKKGLVLAAGALVVAAAGGSAYAATGSSGGDGVLGAGMAAGGAGVAAGGAGVAAGGAGLSQAAGGAARARGLLRRADHATVELKVRGQWVTYTLDRGTVTAVDPTSITVARPDGQSVTETLTPQTRYRGVTSESGIQTGRPAAVVSDGGTALRVRQVPAGGGTA